MRILLYLECSLDSEIDFFWLPLVFVKCDVAHDLYIINLFLLQFRIPLSKHRIFGVDLE